MTYQDTKTPGLSLRITATGTKTFIVYRKVNGRPERITLGRFPAVIVEQARRLAAETNGAIARGENPNDKRRAYRQEIALGELFAAYFEGYAKVHTKTWGKAQQRFETYLSPWARKVSRISREDVRVLHAKLGRENGRYLANRIVDQLKAIYNWTEIEPNPAKGIKKFREQNRDRFLQSDELPRFFPSLGRRA